MPELPEVNAKKHYFDHSALHKKIDQVVLKDVSYILKNISGEAFATRLKGRHFTDSYRRGKYLFAELDNGHHVLFHFGMSGQFKYYEEEHDRPKHERFAIQFDNDFRLGFNCPRKFARIEYIEDLEAFLQKKGLGEDALIIQEGTFIQLTEGRRGTVKGFLLNQKYLAGMGNLYVDEVCWQIGIHPASVMGALSTEKRKELFQRMQAILQKAIDLKATYADYPEEWLWNHRHHDGKCPRDGHPLEIDKVAGRTTYYCPACQELILEG